MFETWCPVKGYENYMISNLGKVISLNYKMTKKPKLMKCGLDSLGYSIVDLSADKKAKKFKVHRLVAMHFIKEDKTRPFVNHKNAIRHDNNVSNLEWCTQKENMDHVYINCLKKSVKLTKGNVIKIRHYLTKKQYNQQQLADMFGVSNQHISDIKNYKTWKNV